MRLTRCLAITTLKCQKELTTASSEDKKDEGVVKASSAIKEARNFNPHMFKEREAIAVRRSFS